MAQTGRPIPWESDLADFIVEHMRHNDRFMVDALDTGVKVYDTWAGGQLMDRHQIAAYKAHVELQRGDWSREERE